MGTEVEGVNQRREDGQDDQRDLDPVEKKAQQKNDREDQDQQSPGPETGGVDQTLDDIIATEGAEHIGETGGGHHDEKDHPDGQRRRVIHAP